MTHASRALRLAGFFMLVLGITALHATVARAEPGAFWKVNGSDLPGALSVKLLASLEENHGVLLTKVGSTEVEVLCIAIKFIDILLKPLGDFAANTGKVHFEGCITKLNGELAEACVPHSPGAANGLIETNLLDGLLVLHETAEETRINLFELLPKESGGPFVTLVLGKAAPEKNECAIGEKFEIKGKTFLEDAQNESSTEKVFHLIRTGPLTSLGFGTNAMTLDGSIRVLLAGAHEGMEWSGIVPALGHWQVNGSTISDELKVELQANELENGDGSLLMKVGASKVEFLCTTITLRNASLKTLGKLSGKIHYEGCITKLNGVTSAACKPHSPGAAEGLIETNALKGIIQLHELTESTKVDLLKLQPEGSAFVTMVLGKGLCPIFNSFDLTGQIVLKDAQEEGLVEKVSHLVVEGPLTTLLLGANPLTFDGSAVISLFGAHEGMKWSGIAE